MNCDTGRSPSSFTFFSRPSCAMVFSCAAAGVCSGCGIPKAEYKGANLSWLAETACGRRLLMTTKTQVQAKATTMNLRMASFIFCSDAFAQLKNETNRGDWEAVIDETSGRCNAGSRALVKRKTPGSYRVFVSEARA